MSFFEWLLLPHVTTLSLSHLSYTTKFWSVTQLDLQIRVPEQEGKQKWRFHACRVPCETHIHHNVVTISCFYVIKHFTWSGQFQSALKIHNEDLTSHNRERCSDCIDFLDVNNHELFGITLHMFICSLQCCGFSNSTFYWILCIIVERNRDHHFYRIS